MLQNEKDTSTIHEEKLERIPVIKKIAGPVDVMDREEDESKILQYGQLWQLYAEISVELKKKSELSQESAVAACKVFRPYISDYKVLEAVDEEITEMLNAVKQSEENYKREQEQARIRDEQLRLARQTNRSDFNFATLANSTPIRSNNIRTDQPGVHFNTNPVRHIYSTTSTTSGDNRYEPPANDSILQGASSAATGQFTTNTTDTTDHNDLWRCNNGTNTATHMAAQECATRSTSRSGFQNNLPNSSDARNRPTCFKCGE